MLESPGSPAPDGATEPRASLLVARGELASVAARIWMGGSHTAIGEPIDAEDLAGAWFIDCAGDMPSHFRPRAGRWFSCVFPDLDASPTRLFRIEQIVGEVAIALQSEHARPSPTELFIVCQHGMNRSGLVAGMLLRALGMNGDDAIDRITASRPGALSNHAFRRLLLDGR
jgi:hypothetical protein